ncbi:MAG: HD-GYP domain-containing protein [Gammaproteobacteria bacterium]|nr:HD-GYP domain-containing protein [Gammaproteobacteria bacterium]MCW8924542.1 HD-GYP domain-containing protein [Gammaproteobacteria bacterium]
MERKVSTFDLTIGMHVANLDRPWLDTPFLLQGFIIEKEADIQALQQHCKYVFIDTEKGEEATSYMDEKPTLPSSKYVEDFLEGGKKKVEYEEKQSAFHELPAAETALETASDKVAMLMDNLKAGDNLDVTAVRQAVQPILESVIRNSDALLWVSEMQKKDAYTYSHSLDNCALAIAFGRHLGLFKEDLRNLAMGLLLMDVGKVKVSDDIINKTGTLTVDEFEEMKNHVHYGVNLLRNTPGINETIINVVLTHHERYDGSGYPSGLKGKEVPVYGRIAAIIDCYTAMTGNSSYRASIAPHKALQTIYNWRNKYFQDELVEQFLQCLGVYPTGSLVEMSSGEVGMIMAQNRVQRLKPKIMMLLDENKKPYEVSKIVDLTVDTTDASGLELSIISGLQSGAYGIDPTKVLED